MSTMAAPLAAVRAVPITLPSGLMNATLAPAPNAPKAGTTVIGLTNAGGVGGTGGVTGVTGVTGVSGVVVVEEEPPPQPVRNAIGSTRVANSLEIFMMANLCN